MNLSPFFCPKCAEIRGVPIGTGTLLIKHEDLYFKSFSMCTVCKEYLNTHTEEQIKQNREEYEILLAELEFNKLKPNTQNKELPIILYYIEKNTSFSVVNFINNLISPYQFSNIIETKTFDNKEYHIRKLTTPISIKDSKSIIELLQKHKIDYKIENVQI